MAPQDLTPREQALVRDVLARVNRTTAGIAARLVGLLPYVASETGHDLVQIADQLKAIGLDKSGRSIVVGIVGHSLPRGDRERRIAERRGRITTPPLTPEELAAVEAHGERCTETFADIVTGETVAYRCALPTSHVGDHRLSRVPTPLDVPITDAERADLAPRKGE